jgi:hypothetical protein
LYVFEEYVDEDAWRVLHHSSAPIKALTDPETWKRIAVSVDIRISEPMGLGFQSR